MVLDDLYSRATIPEYPLRVKWAPHTIIIWDNRSAHHDAPHDCFPQRRTMERVTVAGEPVIAVSGEYVPEEGVAPLPSGHGVVPANPGRRPIREFERG
jgi:taurine dioxygenase